MSHYRWKGSLVTLALVLLLAACAPSAAAAPSTAVAWVAGTMTVTLPPTQPPTKAPAPTATAVNTPTPPGPFPAGDYKSGYSQPYIDEIKFLANGTYAVHYNHASWDYAIQGTYVVKGNQLVLTETMKGRCTGVPETLVWTFDGQKMTFRVAQDNCENASARGLYFSGPWIKQP